MRIGGNFAAVAAAAGVVWAVSTAVNHAQTAAPAASGPTRVAVVDIIKVFDSFNQTRVLNTKIEAHRRGLAQQAEKKEQEIKAEQAALEAFAESSAEWYKRNEQVKRMMFEYKLWEETERQKISDRHKLWVQRTYDMMAAEIARVARAHGAQLVVTTEELKMDVPDSKALISLIMNRKVIYFDPALDLSEEVLANLNAAFEKAGGEKSVEFTN